MRFANLLFRLFAWIEVFSLTILLDGQDKAIAACNDMSIYFDMVESRRRTREELAAARARYIATFRPGVRFTFKNA